MGLRLHLRILPAPRARLHPGRPCGAKRHHDIEHVVPRSVDPSVASSYDNVLLACRYCNRSRSATLSRPERRLLDPSIDAWANHFEFVGSELRFRPGDRDAEYTWNTYDLDDPHKVGQRTWRSKRVPELCEVLTTAPARIAALEALAGEQGRSPAERETILDAAASLRRQLHAARIDLPFFAAIPDDHDDKCRCESSEHHCLPEYLADQIVSVSLS
jgi:hypothetical protein